MPTLAPEQVDLTAPAPLTEPSQPDIAFDLTVGELEVDLPELKAGVTFSIPSPGSCVVRLYCH